MGLARYTARCLATAALALGAMPGGAGAATVAANGDSSYAIDADGRLYAWGSDAQGKLGLGKTLFSATRLQLGAGRSAVVAGYNTSFAQATDGSWWAWGWNLFSMLGDGTNFDRATPVRIRGSYRQIVAAPNHTLALDPEGNLWAWGLNVDGQLGVRSSGTVEAAAVRTGAAYRAIAAGRRSSYGVKADGTLWQWGLLPDQVTASPSPVRVGDGCVAVAAGFAHALALTQDGTVWAWGQNGDGQIGDGSTAVRQGPVVVGRGYSAVFAGYSRSYAVAADGSLWGWGSNAQGELGDGSTVRRERPVRIGAGFVDVSIGLDHTLARKADGSLWAWGANPFGAFGDGSTRGSLVPVPVGSGYAVAAAGYAHSLFIDAQGVASSSGRDDFGALGVFANGPSWVVPQTVGQRFASIAVGGDSALALDADGALWAWGSNEHGQYGDGTRTARTVPTLVGRDFASVSLSQRHALGIKRDGTLWAWGSNGFFALGDGSGTDRLTPVQIAGRWLSVAADSTSSLGVRSDGTLWAWGQTGYGSPGTGDYRVSAVPVQIGEGYRKVFPNPEGGTHFAIRTDGSLWGWGLNSKGELGDGSTEYRSLPPVRVGGGFVEVVTSHQRTLALDADGSLWAWGEGIANAPQRFDGQNVGRSRVPVKIGTGYRAIALGAFHGLAMKADGAVVTWGWNRVGQLGDGSFAPSWRPIDTVDADATGVLDLLPSTGTRPAASLPYLLRLQRNGAGIDAMLTDLRARGLRGEIYLSALLPAAATATALGCTAGPCRDRVRVQGRVRAREADTGMVAGSLTRDGFKQTGGTSYTTADPAYNGELGSAGTLQVASDAALQDSNAVICMGVTVPELSAKGQVLMRPIAVGTAVEGAVQCPPVQTAATVGRFRVEASGPVSARTIVALIDPLPEERGRLRQVFSWAVTPDGRQYMQTGPNQWEDMAETMRPAASVVMPDSGAYRLEVTRDLALDQLGGTLVFIGVGESWEDVRDLNKAGHYYTVQ